MIVIILGHQKRIDYVPLPLKLVVALEAKV